MKHLALFSFLIITLCMPLKAQVGFGTPTLFNDNWEFTLNESTSLPSNSAEWKKVALPHDWSIEGTPSRDLASCTGYLPGGIGWYRKHSCASVDSHQGNAQHHQEA